jgi:holliday junction DNA helicase RuvA
MISHLQGIALHKDERSAVLSIHGVGYKVYATIETLAALEINKEYSLWTHLAVREDALDLYGFFSKDELQFFELLIGISGIGPKTALSILNIASIPTLKKAVLSSDPSYLTKVSGIGKRNAEKIVIELKNKLTATETEETEAWGDHGDSIDALKALGYSERDAREALTKVPRDIEDTSEKIRQALKILGKR